MSHEWTLLIARTSALLFLNGCCVLLLTRWRPLMNPRWHRLAWSVVLLQGVMLFPVSLQVAVPKWWPDHVTRERMPALPSSAETSVPRHSGERQKAESLPSHSLSRKHSMGGDAVEASNAPRSIPVTHSEMPLATASTTESQLSALAPTIESSIPPFEVSNSSLLSATTIDLPTPGNLDRSQGLVSLMGKLTWGSIGIWLIAIWACGMLSVLAVLVSHYLSLHRALMQCRPARRSWARELQELCLELGLHHEVPLDVHPSLGPFLCWTPRGQRVVVPVRLWNRLPATERVAVLHHELCHLRRGDLWKAALARLVVAVHWFNPLAWFSARRFDESAEWSCDALLAIESPARVTPLANALLAAAQAGEKSPLLALSATGGPLFQRVRRLVAWDSHKDTLMQKSLWTVLLLVATCVGSVQLQWTSPALQAADESSEAAADAPAAAAVAAEKDVSETEATASTPATPIAGPPTPLAETAQRIVIGDNENLKKFVTLIQTPTGQVLMADRAAMAAQNAGSNADAASQWEQFVAKSFELGGGSWTIERDQFDGISQYVHAVQSGEKDLVAITAVFHEVATALDGKSEISPVLKRFLEHEAAPAFVYQDELRPRLHPGIDELAEQFAEHLVRIPSGKYVIRPARRVQVERRLAFLDQLQAPLGRFEKELSAWAQDLVRGDELHDQFTATLSKPEFAQYTVFDFVSEETSLRDEELDGMFDQLEEATGDTAAGLKLDPENDQFKEIQEYMRRYSVVWESRAKLATPLHQFADQIEEQDPLHVRLKTKLKTDLALMFVAHEIEYLPVSAEAASREWVAQFATKNEAGKYEITVESTEDLKGQIEDIFRRFRDMRRRGRVVDEFAAQLTHPETKVAMQSLLGKLQLAQLIEQSAERPEVDGLQLWFSENFEETPEGLVLREEASGVIEQVLAEAVEVEKELSKTDF